MKKMMNSKKVLISLIWVLPAMSLVLSLPASARENYRSLQADYLFEKTMADLKETMAKAREGNDEFLMQNGKMQDALDALEQAIADAVAEKTQLKREALRLTDEITLADKENTVMQQRLKNFMTRKERLAAANASIEKNLQALKVDNEQARTSMAALKEEISELTAQSQSYQKPAQHKMKHKDNSALVAQLAAQKKRVHDLEQRLASTKNQKQKKASPADGSQQHNSDLQDRVATSEEELSKAREQGSFLKRQKMSASTEPESVQELRDENDELKISLRDMKDALADLQRVAAQLKPGQNNQIKNLEKSLKKVQQQHNTLSQRMARVSPKALPRVAQMEEYDDLLVRKKGLLRAQADLQNKISDIETQSANHASVAPMKSHDYQAELAKSQVRVAELQKQMISKQSSPAVPGKNLALQKLSNQISDSEKQLVSLRSEGLSLSLPPQPSLSPQESAKAKAAIEQLKSRRAILADSLQAINSKYSLNDLTTKGTGTPEAELKEYFEVLDKENAALQEKLLILQMQQDKQNPTP